MGSLRDIKKRIKSVRNSQKITKAMKLVAASKLKRAQEAVVQARPYATQLSDVLHRVTSAMQTTAAHPLLEVRIPKRVLLLVITSDRGLCGAFNTNVLRHAERFLRENKQRFEHIEIATIGRKARDHFKRRKLDNVREFSGVFEKLDYARAAEIAQVIAQEFVQHQLDSVCVVYNEFKSAISQRVTVQDILPIVHAELSHNSQAPAVDYLFEPSCETILNEIVPRYVATVIYKALLESVASEHGARMTAMESASKNAKEMIETLTLDYNRARQAAITRELMEIIGGAEALNG